MPLITVTPALASPRPSVRAISSPYDEQRRAPTMATPGGKVLLNENESAVLTREPDGTLVGKVRVPEIASNLTFGGPKRNHLFICATSSVYALRLKVNGARYPG